MQKELDKLSNQARFIQMIIDGSLVISKKKKSVLVVELKEKGFKPISKVAEAVKAGETEPVVEEENESADDSEVLSNAYDYLLGMPLWSLTQERVERLRRQIGDKEVEIDTLIKLTKEDIWKKDLDDFINEWRTQLDEEGQRQRKVANMGRRTSSKLMTGTGKGLAARKRKAAAGDDPDDEDFAAPKSKKSATTKKSEPKGGLLNYLSKAPAKPTAPTTDGIQDSDDDFEMEVLPKKNRGASKVESKPKPKVKDDDDDEDFEAEVARKKASAPAKAAPKAKAKTVVTADDDDDLVEIPKPTATQPSRAAARKPVKYAALSDSDSDNGDDLLGDVSKMVKGIGGANDSMADSRLLFSETSRPGSSAGLKAAATKASKPAGAFDADETDYSKLVPQNSPRRSLLVKTKDVKAAEHDLDEEEDDEPLVKPVAKSKPTAKAKTASAAAASKATTATGKPRGRPKKDAAAPAPAPAKKVGLSPAAKAYASKQAKSAKKLADDLSDDDIDAMANDILDSPAAGRGDDEEDSVVKPAGRKTASRPARRTAATKKTYVIEDDSEEEDSAGGDFGDDFSESE